MMRAEAEARLVVSVLESFIEMECIHTHVAKVFVIRGCEKG